MQLTMHTDFALRVLLYLGAIAPSRSSVREISAAYDISENHVTKVVARLSALGYVETLRGRDGGSRLALAPEEILIGEVVRKLEAELGVVACLRAGESCVITPACALKGALEKATTAFLQALDEYTLKDVLRSKKRLGTLLQLGSRPHAAGR